MKELKIKAWDVENKRMLLPNELYNLNFYWIPDGRGFMQLKTGEIFGNDLANKWINHMIPLLCTEIKDKGGTEIWESDILDVDCGNRIVMVAWHPYTASFDTRPIKIADHKAHFESLLNTQWNRRCSIVANIYENPELIK